MNQAALLKQAKASLQTGRLDKAEALCRQVLAAAPGNGGALHCLGIVAGRRGHLGDAIGLLKRSLGVQPKNADVLTDLGTLYLMAGQAEEGCAALKTALSVKPAHTEALYNYGLALLRMGQVDEAIEHLSKACKRSPKNAQALFNLGLAYLQKQDVGAAAPWLKKAQKAAPENFEIALAYAKTLMMSEAVQQARDVYRTLNRKFPPHPEVLFGLGSAAAALNRPMEALEWFGQARQAAPQNGEICNGLAGVYRSQSDYETAEKLAAKGCQLLGYSEEAMLFLASLLFEAGRIDDALDRVEQCLERFPDSLAALNSKAVYLHAAGQFAEAWPVIERIRRLDPGSAESYYLQMADKGHPFTDEAVETMQRLAGDAALSDEARAKLHFALSTHFDGRSDYGAAFDQAALGNGLIVKTSPYDRRATEEYFAGLKEIFTEDFLAQEGGLPSQEPVFVVGMPRSGTTLVERILASHSKVAGLGELKNFGRFEATLPERLNSGEPYPFCLQNGGDGVFKQMGETYLEFLRALLGPAEKGVDKMPANFLRLGLIHRVFPKAKIVYCQRDPMDIGLSLFLTRFTGNHPYSHRLEDIGHYYRLHEDLLEHWRAVGVPIYTVDYEALLGAPEAESKALIDWVGLAWEDGCLKFNEAAGTVKTASQWQVRQPLYKTSQGRWRNYQAQLAPLADMLGRS